MTFRTTTAAVVAALSATGSALAEEVVEKELPEMVVVAASRGSILPEHFAGSSTVIDEETIANSGSRSVADLLAAEGGIRITSTSGNASGGAVHMRGFGENSSSRVLILVDGQPANRPDMGAVSLLEVPLSRIARVEILRGSQTARFGDNAVGGVINFVTKKSDGKPHGFLEAAGGDDGYFLTRGSYSVGGLTFDAERNFSDGWRENSADDLESAAVRYEREISKGVELRAGVAWSDEFTEFPGPLSKAEYEKDPRQSIYAKYGQADQYFSEQTTWRADTTLLLGKGEPLNFEIPLAFSTRDQSWNFGPGSNTDNLLETVSVAPVVRFSRGDWAAEAGLNFRHDSLALDQYAQIERRDKTGKSSLAREVAGGFAGVDWEFFKGWHFNLTGRAERSTVEAKSRSLEYPGDPELNFSRRNDEWNQALQAGVRWETEMGISSWLRYDRLYRLPSTDEIASYQGYPLSVPFNDRLEAEKGHNVELGTEYAKGAWDFRVNGFAQWLEGEIAYDYLRNLNVNFADTRRVGVEFEAGCHSEFFDAKVNYTWLKAEFDDGQYADKDVYLVPRQEFGATVGFHPVKNVTIQGEYQYIGDSFEGNDFENEQEKLPAYGVANLLVRYEPKPGLSIYARINNLTDERYATVKYSGVWYPAAGRQMLVGVRSEF